MAMFVNDHMVIDTDFLVSAGKMNGTRELDGQHAITAVLAIGDHGKDEYFDFPTAQARDEAFKELTMFVKIHHPAAVEESTHDQA